jgi:hypothetical protein
MRFAAAALALLVPAVPLGHAQGDAAADARRATVERDRMSEDLARRIRQDRMRMDVPAGDPRRSQALEQQIIRQNQAADALGARQDLEMRTRRGGAAQAEYDAQRHADERRAEDTRAAREAEAQQRDEAARQRRERPEPHTPTLDPQPRRWGPTL